MLTKKEMKVTCVECGKQVVGRGNWHNFIWTCWECATKEEYYECNVCKKVYGEFGMEVSSDIKRYCKKCYANRHFKKNKEPFSVNIIKKELQEVQAKMHQYLDIRTNLRYNKAFDADTKHKMYLELEKLGKNIVKELAKHNIEIEIDDIAIFIIEVEFEEE